MSMEDTSKFVKNENDDVNFMTYQPGDVVETVFGVGVIIKCPNNISKEATGAVVVGVDDDDDDDDVDGSIDNLHRQKESIQQQNEHSSSLLYHVLLWRRPGQSIASSSLAYLQPETLIKKLPAAPGMVTNLNKASFASQIHQGQYMVQAYYSNRGMYRIIPVSLFSSSTSSNQKQNDTLGETSFVEMSSLSPTGQLLSSSSTSDHSTNNDQEKNLSLSSQNSISDVYKHAIEVTPDQIEHSSSATFYPLLCQLMKRGDEAAYATKQFLQTQQVQDVVEKTKYHGKQTINQFIQDNQYKIENINRSTSNILENGTNVQKNEQVQQLLELLKTEELTVLLEKGKERLEQLLQNDIPQATKTALEKSGIRIADDEFHAISDESDSSNTKSLSSYKRAIVDSRKAALEAMRNVLQQTDVDSDDVDAIRQSLNDNFGTLLDNWAQAAKTDQTLYHLLTTVNEHTAAWQEATGRILQTRSASIFLDGANRLNARTKILFSKEQLQWVRDIGSKFTKAFTEGDAAVARLKTIELGDNVRDRLVKAIELRSESSGGLDGIIAGALTTMALTGTKSGDSKSGGKQLNNILAHLQSHASKFTKESNETLVSLLARQSEYRDVALLKLEQVFCDLKSQFGHSLSPEEMALLAQGEGGTAIFFEPIAKRAAKEIEKQLDVAESSISDPSMVKVLQHVREIVSGELTMGAVLDEMVNVLNDDKMVAAGENIVKHGEQVLDAIEGVDTNKVVGDVITVAEKAGITKDNVMERIERLDVNQLLNSAGTAITDEKARRKLLSDSTDTALDFILRILPSMPVPPVDGVKDGLVYHISNLSMEGFKVKKENILVEIAGMRATKKPSCNLKFAPLDQSEVRGSGVEESGTGRSHADIANKGSITSVSSFDSSGIDFDTAVDTTAVIKATELLIIDVSEISSFMKDVAWSFEQTYMPYLKGNGKFDVKMSGGAIRLVFELRKLEHKIAGKSGNMHTNLLPVLCLHDRSCSIGSVEFNMQGESRLAWVVNKVASIFKSLLRDYVERTILRILSDKSGWILSKLNQALRPFWDVLLRTSNLSMEDLQLATPKDIMDAIPAAQKATVELVWRERLPLGMNLLLNDESGQLKVVDFPRGSQARAVCEKRNFDPDVFKGATIKAVNGIRYQTEDELFEALRDAGRPKAIQFELAEFKDAERIRKFVEESQALDPSILRSKVPAGKRFLTTRTVTFEDDMDLGIEFAKAPDNIGLVVQKFLESEEGLVLAAERRKDIICIGDLLSYVNGKLVIGDNGSGRAKALTILGTEGNKRPLSLTFADPYLHSIVYQKNFNHPYLIGGPEELILCEDKNAKRIMLEGFKDVAGCAEKAGVMLGDYLVFVNGLSVGAGCRWMGEATAPSLSQVEEMLHDVTNYPIGLTFARPAQRLEVADRGWKTTLLGFDSEQAISLEASESTCVTADKYDQLGLVLEVKEYNDIVVRDLCAISGPYQEFTQKLREVNTGTFSHLSIHSVNGEFVPSFSTTQMVKSAMERSWKTNDFVEVTYCDDAMKAFVHGLPDDKSQIELE